MTEILNPRDENLFAFNRQRVNDKFRPNSVNPNASESNRNFHRFNANKKQLHSAATTTTGTTSTTRTSSAADSNQHMTKIVKLPPAAVKPNRSSNLIQQKTEFNSGSNQSLATTSHQNNAAAVITARREQSNATPASSLNSNNKQPFFEYVSSKKASKASFRPPSSTDNKDSILLPHAPATSTSVGSNLESIELIKINKSLKSKLYSSYLIYSSSNPFSSNYDLINKENPDFYESLCKASGDLSATYRFNRASSSLSLLHNYMDKKKFESYLNEEKETKSRLSKSVSVLNDEEARTEPPVVDERSQSRAEPEVARHKQDLVDMDEQLSSRSHRGGDSVKNNKNKTSWSAIKRAQQANSASRLSTKRTNAESSRAQANSQTIELNQFLNYRKEPKKEETPNRPNTALLTCNLYTFLVPMLCFMIVCFFVSATAKNNRLNRAQNDQNNTNTNAATSNSQTTNKNTAELYLDPVKLAYIKNWVQRVNQVQAVEGKWTETINKILFYD